MPSMDTNALPRLRRHFNNHAEPAAAVATPRPRTERPETLPGAVRLEAVWARHGDEVRAAQRLRHRVFVDEMGARPTPLPGTPQGLDVDHFDAHCEHLLVRTVAHGDTPAEVVGTYRVLTPEIGRAHV